MKLNQTLVFEHAEVDGRQSWQEHAHVLLAEVLVVWQLHFDASDAGLFKHLEQVREGVVVRLHQWSRRLQEPV